VTHADQDQEQYREQQNDTAESAESGNRSLALCFEDAEQHERPEHTKDGYYEE
jgi:hypothetical protein